MKRIYYYWRRVKIFSQIVWRYDHTETRMCAKTAWEIAVIFWPESELSC